MKSIDLVYLMLQGAVQTFADNESSFISEVLVHHAKQFDKDYFMLNFKKIVEDELKF